MIILVILGVLLLQAYKSFSGYDPMTLDPKSSLKGLLTSDSAYELVTGLLTFNPQKSLDASKKVLSQEGEGENVNTNQPVILRYAVIADSHKDTENLKKALAQAKEAGAEFIIGMGDFSDVGTVEELSATKMQFDEASLPYYLSPGDHDLWDSRDKGNPADANFREVFGETYQSFSNRDYRFILIYNSDNYLGLDGVELSWIEDELNRLQENSSKLIFVFAPTPLFHPSSDHVMGKENEKLKNQAEHLISIFSKAGVNQVFSADTHFFSKYTEPQDNLKMVTVGAVTSDRNPQTPRFAIVDIYEDGSYNIEEVEVK
jgi:hypothetical protein